MSVEFTDFASAEAVEEAFYEGLRNGDLSVVMGVWAEDDDIVVCIHPNGPRLTGMHSVRASWEAILHNGGLQVQPVQQHCMVGAAMAVHNVVEALTVTGSQGSEVLYCYATNVYIKDAGGWRMVMHHATPAGDDDDEPPSLSAGGEILH